MNGLQRIAFLPLKRAAKSAGSRQRRFWRGKGVQKEDWGASKKQAALRTGKRLPEKAA